MGRILFYIRNIMHSEEQDISPINKAVTILAASAIQVSVGWFLLNDLVFMDSYPNLTESSLYFLLALTPHVATLATYIKTTHIKQAASLGILGYLASAAILTLTPFIDGFYVTGVGGVGPVSLSVMTTHLIILLFTLTVLKMHRNVNGARIDVKNFLIILLCVAASLSFLGFFKMLPENIVPNSYSKLNYQDPNDLAISIGVSLFVGLLSTILDIRILATLMIYAALIFILLEQRGANLSFNKKILVIFLPIWITISVFTIMYSQELRRGPHNNLGNFDLGLSEFNHRLLC